MSRRIQTGAAAVQTSDPTGSADSPEFTFAETEGLAGSGKLSGPEELLRPLTLGIASPMETRIAAPTPPVEADGYLDRLVKYIPAEIIALYLGATNVVPIKDGSYWMALWIIAGITAACTPIYMYIATREKGQPTLWSQIIISSIAFPIWVFAIGGPFRCFGWYDQKQWIAAIIISFSTFMMGMYKPKPAPVAVS